MKKFNGPAIELLLKQQYPQPDSISIILSDFVWLIVIISALFSI